MRLLTLVQVAVLWSAIIVLAGPVPGPSANNGDTERKETEKEKEKGREKKCVPGECPKKCPKPDPLTCIEGDHKCSIPGTCSFIAICDNLVVACGADTTVTICVPQSVPCSSLLNN
jgi:hypothetical protein